MTSFGLELTVPLDPTKPNDPNIAGSLYSPGTVPTGIAPHLPLIINRIKQKPTDTITVSKKLEDKLIHFSHGRKLERGESDDPVHAAKQIREYLDSLKQA